MPYSLTNDYSEGAHPSILAAIAGVDAAGEQNGGYGLDRHCEHATALIRKVICNNDAQIHYLVGGTQTNMVILSTVLRPWEAVICAHTGHIAVHETGAIEATGHKVLTFHSDDGKVRPADVERVMAEHISEHMVLPKMVYISNSTEIGTIYKKQELQELSAYCRSHNLYLMMDGARLGSALTSCDNDLTMADIAELVDVFYIGGTKNGALFGEAIVILNSEFKELMFRYSIKHRGGLLAKGWLLGIQFEQLFQDDLFFRLARHANSMATICREGLEGCGIKFSGPPSFTNQLFPVFPNDLLKAVSARFKILSVEPADANNTVTRVCTSWATKEDECREFVKFVESLVVNV